MWLAKVIVTLKPVINDPQGLTIRGALQTLGYSEVNSVRAGKYLEITLDAPDRESAAQQVDRMCHQLLANPVIENYSYEIAPLPADA